MIFYQCVFDVDNREAIEENLKSLESLIKLLVPDIFDGNGEVEASRCYGPSDFREHGFHSAGEINITLSIDFARTSDGAVFRFPEVRIKLNADTAILRDSGQEFMNQASKHHRPILSEYLEV